VVTTLVNLEVVFRTVGLWLATLGLVADCGSSIVGTPSVVVVVVVVVVVSDEPPGRGLTGFGAWLVLSAVEVLAEDVGVVDAW